MRKKAGLSRRPRRGSDEFGLEDQEDAIRAGCLEPARPDLHVHVPVPSMRYCPRDAASPRAPRYAANEETLAGLAALPSWALALKRTSSKNAGTTMRGWKAFVGAPSKVWPCEWVAGAQD
jgi:hypothetical protein